MNGQPLYIFGAGGHAREVLQLVNDINAAAPDGPAWQPMGFMLDDGFDAPATELHGLPILQGRSRWSGSKQVAIAVAIGQSAARSRVVARLQALGYCDFPTLVHPSAWLASQVTLGQGNIIFAGCHLNTDVTLGEHVHVNLACSISHDSVIGSYSTLGPGTRLCGHCRTGEGVDIGASTTLIPKASIGAWSIVGAGSVVIGSIGAQLTAVGTPARAIKAHADGWHSA
jgi:sugar O-acyltransferase (sialic acid O-acetyltransferase NeuD family)